jgi:ABC-type nitrate/sulfonate/bicarbonate transport system permease component
MNTAVRPAARAAATEQPPGRTPIRRRKLWAWLPPLILVAVATGAWEGGVRLTDTPRWFFPPPSAVAREMLDSRALLWRHTWTTFQEIVVGLAIATVLAVALAIAIASSRIAQRSLLPIVIATQAVPIIALAPILLIWFGYGMTPKVIVVVLTCFFPIVVNLVDGLRSVDGDALRLLRSMGASRAQLMRLVRIPSALPYLFSGLRIAASISVIGAIVGEWVGASSGLGYLMTRSAAQFQTARLFGAVMISACLSVLLFAVVALIERRVLRWKYIAEG